MFKAVFDKEGWNKKDYHFHLDVNASIPNIRGWFVNKSNENYALKLVDQSGNVLDAIEFFKYRPKLVEIYPDIEGIELAGFELNTSKVDPTTAYAISIFKDSSEITQLCFLVKNAPLLYVHIAKTAGSTVNKVLTDLFMDERSVIHAESRNDWEELVANGQVDFLSGHIEYENFNQVPSLQCFKKAITFREPYAHVVSHLCWIRALSLAEKKRSYDAHPEYIQRLSDTLATCDFTCPDQLSEVIANFNDIESRLLDNTQTRYIRKKIGKKGVDYEDVINSIENLKSFEYIGTDNGIRHFLSEILRDYGAESELEDRRENVLSCKFGFDLTDSKIKKALYPLVKYDLELYRIVQSLPNVNGCSIS